MIDKSFFNEPDHVTEIKGGDWEKATEPVTEYDLYQAMKTVFENGHDWEETDFYERVVDIIQGGQQKWGCSSVSEFDKRCARLNILYETIKKQGYKSQNEIGSGNPNDPIKNQRNYRYAPELSEVIVVIDQSGEFYFYDGRHRFIISKLLNIDRIPVRVKARHANWQILREQYLYDDLRHEEHPDLQYISNHK